MQDLNAGDKMNHARKYVLLVIPILVIGGVLASIFGAFQVYRFFNPYLDRKVAGPVTLSPQWLEIEPKEPLRIERKDQYIVFEIAEPLTTPNPSLEPTSDDGSIVTFEVQLVDQNGNRYDLTEPAGDGRAEVWRGMGMDKHRSLPARVVFRTVRVRSNKTLKCSSILWRAYDPSDFK